MLTGGGGHGNNDEMALSGKQQMEQKQQYKNPCEFEWKQFIEWSSFTLIKILFQ